MPSLISQLWNSKSWRTPPTPIALPWRRPPRDFLERGAHALGAVLPGNTHFGREVAGSDMQHVDALDRGDLLGVLDRLRGLDHCHQHGFLIEDLAHLGLRDRRVAELRAAAERRAVAFGRVEACLHDILGL